MIFLFIKQLLQQISKKKHITEKWLVKIAESLYSIVIAEEAAFSDSLFIKKVRT